MIPAGFAYTRASSLDEALSILAKDADANTAFSKTVEPLPFHSMSAYPYRQSERFPQDASHRDYIEQYNVRPALQLLRPLAH